MPIGLAGFNNTDLAGSVWGNGGFNSYGLTPAYDLTNQTVATQNALAQNAPGLLNVNATPDTNSFLGLSGGTWQGIGMGLQGLAGLASAYTGLQNYQLAKQQFNYQKRLANRNLANQSKTINNTYDNAANVAAGMIGGTDNSGRYGYTSSATIDRYLDRARSQHVDGSPV